MKLIRAALIALALIVLIGTAIAIMARDNDDGEQLFQKGVSLANKERATLIASGESVDEAQVSGEWIKMANSHTREIEAMR